MSQKPRLLAIDDEPGIRASYQFGLDRVATPDVVDTFSAGIERIVDPNYGCDVVLTDLSAIAADPGKTGLDIIAAVQQYRKGTPVFVISAVSQVSEDSLAESVKKYPDVAMLAKPFDLQRLRTIVVNSQYKPNELDIQALVIDDEHPIRLVIQRLLSRFNVESTDKANAEEGVAEFLMHPDRYDLVLTDIRMPGSFDGLHVARCIREVRPEHRGIYLMSGFHNYDMNQIESTVGGGYFIEKPFKMVRAIDILNQCAARKLPDVFGAESPLRYILPYSELQNMQSGTIGEDGVVAVHGDFTLVYSNQRGELAVLRDFTKPTD